MEGIIPEGMRGYEIQARSKQQKQENIIEVLLNNIEMIKFDNEAIKKAMRDKIAELEDTIKLYDRDMSLFDTDILVSENERLRDELKETALDRDNIMDYLDQVKLKVEEVSAML